MWIDWHKSLTLPFIKQHLIRVRKRIGKQRDGPANKIAMMNNRLIKQPVHKIPNTPI